MRGVERWPHPSLLNRTPDGSALKTLAEQRAGGAEFRAFWRILRRRFVLVAACVLIAAGSTIAFSLSQPKEYSSSASLLFRDPQLDQTLFGSTFLAPSNDPQREAATNAKLVSLQVVSARTAQQLGNRFTAAQIRSKVTITAEGQSNVVSITATDTDPRVAAQIPNVFAQQYIEFRRDADRSKISDARKLVEKQLAQLGPIAKKSPQGRSLQDRAEQLDILASLQTGNAELVQPATIPSSASSPTPKRDGILGAALGLVLGIGLALFLERVDRRLRDPKEISDSFDRPMLGAIPESRAIARAQQAPHELGAGEAEAFRMLRANLRYFNVDKPIRSVLITSASPSEGKSTVAVHLAVAAASTGGKVLLVEADLRRPTLAEKLGIGSSVGLSHVLSGDLSLQDAAQVVPLEGGGETGSRTIDVVVAGPIPPNPADLLESARMRDVLSAAEQEYDLVVVDTPPTSVVSDAIPLVKEVSGVIVVTRLGKTTRESAAHLRSQLENLDAHTLGVVVNSVGKPGSAGYSGYGYGYGYGYTESKKPARRGKQAPATPTLPTRGSLHSNGNANGAGAQPREDASAATAATAVVEQGEPARRRRTPRRWGGQ
jgi:succinoglycan biosynthesis transport protein ExoP